MATAQQSGMFQCGLCKRDYKRLDHLSRHVRSRKHFLVRFIEFGVCLVPHTDRPKIRNSSRTGAISALRASHEQTF